MVKADAITAMAESNLYADDVILSRTSPTSAVVLTAWKDDLRCP